MKLLSLTKSLSFKLQIHIVFTDYKKNIKIGTFTLFPLFRDMVKSKLFDF